MPSAYHGTWSQHVTQAGSAREADMPSERRRQRIMLWLSSDLAAKTRACFQTAPRESRLACTSAADRLPAAASTHACELVDVPGRGTCAGSGPRAAWAAGESWWEDAAEAKRCRKAPLLCSSSRATTARHPAAKPDSVAGGPARPQAPANPH